MDPEDCPEWVEAVDYIDTWLDERMNMTRAEAWRQHEETEARGAVLDEQLAQESEASLLDYEDEEEEDGVGEEEGELVVDADGEVAHGGKRRKLR